MSSHPLADLCYVCVVSDFTLPNFEACLLRRPRRIALIVSDPGKLREAAVRLKKQLEGELPETVVDILTGQPGAPLQGDNLIENQHWTRTRLLPWLTQAGLPPAKHLNFTGGTKTMTAVLLDAYPWDGFDYTANGQLEIQTLQRRRDGDSHGFIETARSPVASASPLQVARLYAEAAACDPLNRLARTHPEATLALARRMWAAQQDNEPALAQVLAAFDRVWSNSEAYPAKQVELSWPAFLGQAAPEREQLGWLNAFSALAPDETFRLGPDGVSIPGNKCKGNARALRDWIGGIWLEQLGHAWLLEAGLKDDWIARNIHAGVDEKNSSTQREADLLIHHRNTTLLIEAKAGLPDGTPPRQMLQQLTSLGDLFGRTRKGLLMSPALCRQLEDRRKWDAFMDSCAAQSVTPIGSQAALTRFVAPVLAHRPASPASVNASHKETSI
jgi:hypothetical protein